MTTARIATALLCTLFLPGCGFDVPDLNRPGLDQVLANPTPEAIGAAATGLVAGSRADMAQRIGYVSELGILGRESYVLTGSDDRFVTELLNGITLDPGTPNFGGNFWVVPYQNIRNANLLLDALPKVAGLTAAEKESVQGFAQTMMALDFLKIINTHDVNGAPIDVDLPIGQLAPIVGKDAVFDRIALLLDQGKTHLAAASAQFPFPLGNGFTNFNTPARFLLVNRALAARVEVYRGRFSSALTALSESFVDITAPLSLGAYHAFGLGSGDLQNDLNTSDIYAHPSVVTDAEMKPGGGVDDRVTAKVTPVPLFTLYMLSSDHGFKIYPNKDSPVPIIRNEELILLRAEANIGLGNVTTAATDINFIRTTSGGLAPRTLDSTNVLDELLKQKRYSLLFEGGHRWIDARRYGKLGTLPIDLPNQRVQTAFPIPTAETDARR